MSAPSLFVPLALVAADPALAGHPVVVELLTVVECELVDRLRVLEAQLAALREENAGTAVHDRFAAYWSSMADETVHALCNVHLLRNLKEIVELEKEPDGWAARMQRLLLEARDTAAHWHGKTDGLVPTSVRAATAAAWGALLAPVPGHHESLPPPTRGRGRRRGHNLALRKEREACLRFLVPGRPGRALANNRAERALRMTKVHIKIAGCFRTWDGAERFALLRGLVKTARQREWNLLDFLRLGPDAAVMPKPP